MTDNSYSFLTINFNLMYTFAESILINYMRQNIILKVNNC